MWGLAAYFVDLASAWNCDPNPLVESGLSAKLIERILVTRESVDLDQVWARIEARVLRVLGSDPQSGQLAN